MDSESKQKWTFILLFIGIICVFSGYYIHIQDINLTLESRWQNNRSGMTKGLDDEWKEFLVRRLNEQKIIPMHKLLWSQVGAHLKSDFFPTEEGNLDWKIFQLTNPSLDFLKAAAASPKESWDRALAVKSLYKLSKDPKLFVNLSEFESTFVFPEAYDAYFRMFQFFLNQIERIEATPKWTFRNSIFLHTNENGFIETAVLYKSETSQAFLEFQRQKQIPLQLKSAEEIELTPENHTWVFSYDMFLILFGVFSLLFAFLNLMRHLYNKDSENLKRLLFFDLIVHEINTPLTAALIHQDLALNALKSGKMPLSNNLETVERNLHDMQQLIDEYSFLNQKKALVLSCIQEDEAKWLQEEVLRLFAKKLSIVNWPKCTLYGDRRLIKIILINLIKNGIQYGKSVEIDGKLDEEFYCFMVRDKGPGLSKSETRKIFRRFIRGSVGKKDASGMGLGLYIARRLAREQGGDVYLQNPGKPHAEFCVKIRRLSK